MSLFRKDSSTKKFIDVKGGPFFALGVNYEGYFDRAWHMWEEDRFDLDLISHDFGKAQKAGFNTVRIFVQYRLGVEVKRGIFDKLDHVLDLAREHELYVLLTLNDYHSLDLAAVGEVDGKIAARYHDDEIILGYDLENEPVFYNVMAAIYPDEFAPPVYTDALVKHYGERVSMGDMAALRSARRIPSHLTDEQGYYYYNALKLFQEFDSDAGKWMNANSSTMAGYINSDASDNWKPFVDVLNGTLESWIKSRSKPIRSADKNHMLTVGYNWQHFAVLPANRALDFHEYHHYSSPNMSSLKVLFRVMDGLKSQFPDSPVIMGEFGNSNATSQDPLLSQSVPANLTALYESAIMTRLHAEGFAGVYKWMLNDVESEYNPYEASFGVFALEDKPKPIYGVVQKLGSMWEAKGGAGTGSFSLTRDTSTGMSYRYDWSGETVLGGGIYQDEALAWQPEEPGLARVRLGEDVIYVDVLTDGRITVDPDDFSGAWAKDRESVLYRQRDEVNYKLATFKPGDDVNWYANPGYTYIINPGEMVKPPEQIKVEPGQHVLLLPTGSDYLDAAMGYISHFKPDFSFAPAAAVGKWPYVTIIGPVSGITREEEAAIKNGGAKLVERIDGASPLQVKSSLEQMTADNRRFIMETTETPTGEPDKTYTVQPGDSLSAISQKMYGSWQYWNVIYEANRDILESPSRIRPGQVLKIPPKP